MDKKLLKYIEDQLRAGFNREEIKEVLVKANYEVKTIEKHFKHVFSNKRKNLILVGVAGVLIVLIVILLIFLFSSTSKVVKETITIEEDSSEADKGFLKQALIERDSAFCNNIKAKETKEECLAEFTEERECDEDCEARNILKEAIVRNNVDVCDEILIETIKEECLAIFVEEPEVECDENCQDKLRMKDALIERNKSLCVNVVSETLRTECETSLS